MQVNAPVIAENCLSDGCVQKAWKFYLLCFENKKVNVLCVYAWEHYTVTLASLSELTQALK